MKVYATMEVDLPLARVGAYAQRAERLGYDGLSVPEAQHDGVLVALLALEHTRRLRVGTGVLVAFARSPMLVAQDAWDLQRLSGGRFELGLGSQVRGNIERRYGMAWRAPAPRMRDYVGALRAVFRCWQEGEPLHYESEHYTLTRMQPYFSPGPIDHPEIPILLGAVNPAMTRVVGEVGDALMMHPTNSDPRYLREVTLPALEQGAKRAGRDPDAIEVMPSPFIATGRDAGEVAAARERIRATLAFLYSTPAYRPSLAHHGFAELGERLHAYSRAGRWQEMGRAIGDELLERLVPSGPYAEIAGVLRDWYGGLAGRITFPMPEDPERDGPLADVIRELRGSGPNAASWS